MFGIFFLSRLFFFLRVLLFRSVYNKLIHPDATARAERWHIETAFEISDVPIFRGWNRIRAGRCIFIRSGPVVVSFCWRFRQLREIGRAHV